MSTDTYLAPEEIVKLFGDCRIVDGMQWVCKEPNPQAYNQENLVGETYRVGCAMRFDQTTEDNQRLLQYAWFVHMPNGEYAVGNFLDAKEINTAIDAARAGEKRKDEDPSILLGELLDQDAKRLGKIIAESASMDDVKPRFENWVENGRRNPIDMQTALESDELVASRIAQGLTKLNIFKDIDSAKARKYCLLFENYSKRAASYVLDNKGKAVVEIGHQAKNAGYFVGAVGETGREIALALSGPEVQAVTRALMALMNRMNNISESLAEKSKELRDELNKHKSGAEFKAGNTIAAGSDPISQKIKAVEEEYGKLSRKQKGELWDAYFDTVRDAEQNHELVSPNEKKALAAAMGLGVTPEVAVESVCSMAANDALVNQVIENALEADLLADVDAVTDKVLAERHQENVRRKEAAEKDGKGEKPKLLSRYTDDGFPIRRETIGAYVNAKVNAIRAENLCECEKYLKNGQQPSVNQVKLFTAKNLAGATLLSSYTGHEMNESLMNKALGISDSNFQIEPTSQTLSVPVAESKRTHGGGRRLVQAQNR